MKKYWIIALLGMAVSSFSQQADNGEVPACDCASCREKAASGKEFTLPGLQGLEEGRQAEQTQDEQEDADHAHDEHEHGAEDGHDHAEQEEYIDGHRGDSCCPSDGATEATPQDPDGESQPDQAAHDDDDGHNHDSHVGHDHSAEEVEHDDLADHVEAEGVELTDEMVQKLGIQIHAAEGGTIGRASIFPAEIKLNRDRTAAVSARYASIVRQVFAEIGDTVQKGDVLASLENRETLAVYSVSAPLDGIVISKNLSVGESADVERELFEVADLSSVWADISIFPKYQHLLRKGMPVKFIAHDGHTTEGIVKYISPIISHETRTFTARCVLEGADEDFTPGAFVRARINTETAAVAVMVEREAIQVLGGEPVLFVPAAHGFQTLEVELGLADDHNVEIKSGLKPGERYVAVGAFALKAQMVTSGMDPHAGHGH